MDLGASQRAVVLHGLCLHRLLLQFLPWLHSGMEYDGEVQAKQTLSAPRLLLVTVFQQQQQQQASEGKHMQAHPLCSVCSCSEPVLTSREADRLEQEPG